MRNLSATNRCFLFEEIAEEVWHDIVYNHRERVQVNEPGKTNDIVALIRNHARRNLNFGLWSNNGYNEAIHGSDIDIFVETSADNFIWFALQAKVLKLNGTYDGMDTLRNGEYQWEKLQRLSDKTGCVSKYLLYNGVDNYNYNGSDLCNRPFDELQFGCSLVDKCDVERVSLCKTPTFNDFHPNFAQPWRVIVCCWKSFEKEIKYYSSKQIKSSVRKYYPILDRNLLVNLDQDTEFEDDSEIINKLSEEENHEPMLRMVVRNTTSLMKIKNKFL